MVRAEKLEHCIGENLPATSIVGLHARSLRAGNSSVGRWPSLPAAAFGPCSCYLVCSLKNWKIAGMLWVITVP